MNTMGLRVLVVDDDQDATDSLAKLLRVRGHSPIVANNGPDAVELARQFPPDVAFLDIGLPGMDGCDVARILFGQSSERRPLLVAISGYGQEDDYKRSREAGMDLHLVKPVEPEQLFQLLTRFSRVLQ
jgi:two-component system CheB/CheR fusion protein